LQSALREQVINWLSKGRENARRLIDLNWKVEDKDNLVVLENAKIPFVIFMHFGEKLIHLFVDTGVETATVDNATRLSMYRVLLILNRRTELVKFMLNGTNENITARVDLDVNSITKREVDEAMNVLLSSVYIMVKELNLEEQFHERVLERMYMMIESMEKEGKSRNEIMVFLTEKVGVKDDEAKSLMQNFSGQKFMSREEEEMYR
jgi:hypothetical protein